MIFFVNVVRRVSQAFDTSRHNAVFVSSVQLQTHSFVSVKSCYTFLKLSSKGNAVNIFSYSN